jgi:hypothetical protein
MKIKEISLLIMILIVAMMTVGIVAITDSVTAAGAPAKLSQANLGTNSSYTNAFMSEHCKSWSSTGVLKGLVDGEP